MSTIDDLGLSYRFEGPEFRSTPATLLLLHDAAGDESQLWTLGRQVWKDAALLAPRAHDVGRRNIGKSSKGEIDGEDVRVRAEKLAEFIEKASLRHDFQFKHLVAIGYSSGATIAASLILLHPHHLGAAILLRPRLPFTPEIIRNFTALSILISAARHDDVVGRDEVEQLAAIFESGGAEVSILWQQDGHELNSSDIDAAKAWLSEERIQKHLAA